MSKSKRIGTAFESFVVSVAHARGLKAWRLAEGGSNDAGDVVVVTSEGDHVILECKARERLSAHIELAKAIEKAAKADTPFMVDHVGLAWKRLGKKEGNERRSAVGAGITVTLTLNDYLDLLNR